MNNQTETPRIVVALDYPELEQARRMVAQLDPTRCRIKVGKELFVRAGPEPVRQWIGAGFAVFLDLKFHDIPNTVRAACRAAAELGVWMVNVHAMGGRAMMAAAREGVDAVPEPPLLTAVTVLTSHDATSLAEIGIVNPPEVAASGLAKLAAESGADGVVCSAQEAGRLRAERGPGFTLVTPGIRPAASQAGDQRRVATPAAALAAGADYLVVGRPITQAKDPMGALAAIEAEMHS